MQVSIFSQEIDFIFEPLHEDNNAKYLLNNQELKLSLFLAWERALMFWIIAKVNLRLCQKEV
jgi:hypothetical protein